MHSNGPIPLKSQASLARIKFFDNTSYKNGTLTTDLAILTLLTRSQKQLQLQQRTELGGEAFPRLKSRGRIELLRCAAMLSAIAN